MSFMCSKSRAECQLTEAVFALAVWHISDYSFVAFFVARLKLPEPNAVAGFPTSRSRCEHEVR
jgi:hypothetical protein